MRWKKALSVAGGVLAGLFFAACLLLMIAAVVMRSRGDGNATWLFGYGMFQIVSGSMEPEISPGDVVVGKKEDFAGVAPGDNIVFRFEGKLITHKVIAVNGDGTVTTQGLANDAPDAPVAAAQYVATQRFVVRGLGGLLDFIRSKYGFLLLVLLPIGGLIAFESVSLTKKLKLYRRERAEEERRAEDAEAARREIEELKRRLDKK